MQKNLQMPEKGLKKQFTDHFNGIFKIFKTMSMLMCLIRCFDLVLETLNQDQFENK